MMAVKLFIYLSFFFIPTYFNVNLVIFWKLKYSQNKLFYFFEGWLD